jgi:hypothetical protein
MIFKIWTIKPQGRKTSDHVSIMAIGLIKDCIKEKTEILTSQGTINHAFPRLHDSYSSDPAIYLNECVFSWQNLLVEPLNRF